MQRLKITLALCSLETDRVLASLVFCDPLGNLALEVRYNLLIIVNLFLDNNSVNLVVRESVNPHAKY